MSENFLVLVVHTLTKLLHHLGSAITQLAQLIVRLKSLTLRCSSGLFPWWSSCSSDSLFPSSLTLERIRIITPGPFPTVEGCRALDNTFSDTDRYPSLVELEVVLFGMTEFRREEKCTLKRLCMDEHLPRLKALGRLPSSSTRSSESVRPVDTFGSVADAYYKDSM